jgi:eukaryotic-like serine/threonine-protein kinase
MDQTPETLLKNRYRIEHALGQGGMGAVYLAIDTALDTPVAVKSNRSTAPDSTTQFLREARLLASLHHPHLPRVTDYFILGEMQYLVMDYIPGQDLDTLIRQEKAQPFRLVHKWANQLGDAICFLHHQAPPIIHRDVKPANVRLTNDGDVILVDFGIAKVVDASQATTAGASAYTPGYAPPEQYGGNVRTGPYTDQYSLAALCYHLLTGEKPADAIQRALGRADLTPIDQLVDGVPAYFAAALDRALSLRPTERFADINDFVQAINGPINSHPSANSSTDVTVMEATARQKPPEAVSSLPTVISSPPAVPPRMPVQVPPPPAAGQPPAAPRKSRRPLVIAAAVLAAACLFLTGAGALAAVMAPRFLPFAAIAPRSTATSQAPSPAAALPLIASTSTPAPHNTDTPAPALPSDTPTPAPTETLQPTDTPIPSSTPVPSATPLAVGGGGQVLFASNRGDGSTFQLWTMQVWLNDLGQAAAGELKQITDGPGDKRQPAWSPDGKQIVYVAPGSKGLDLWVMNSDGSGEPVAITSMNGDELEPAWSPDGSWIAFTSDGRSDGVLQLYLVRPDGGELVRLSSFQDESSPAWAPDMRLGFVMNIAGNHVLYIRDQRDPATGAAPTQAYYVTPTFFDFTAIHGNLGQVYEPAWSPDGQWVVYTRKRSSGPLIYLSHYPVREPVEKDILRLTDTNSDYSPAWSPDGQWIVFASERDGNSEIYIMRSTGNNQDNLTGSPAEDVDPTWFH